jgi:hypothetical protein
MEGGVKRVDVIRAVRFAGYHKDQRAAIRLRVEKRIGFAAWREAYSDGARARASGIACGCSDCATSAE